MWSQQKFAKTKTAALLLWSEWFERKKMKQTHLSWILKSIEIWLVKPVYSVVHNRIGLIVNSLRPSDTVMRQ